MLARSTRGVGAIELLRELLPGVALAAFALATWLGSVAFLVGLIAVVYWFESRNGGAFALAAVLGGYALTLALKAVFALSRPPASLWLVGASGYGFPSGHAIVATVGWGALALVIDRSTRRRRFAVFAVVVAVVACSRVVLGVHYAVDVVAGVAVGAVYLGVLRWLGEPVRAFAAATVVAVLAALLTRWDGDALLVLGGAAGSWLVWSRVTIPRTPWDRSRVVAGVLGAAAVGGLLLVGYLAWFPPPSSLVIGAVAFAVLIGLPALVDRPGLE